jgi:nitroimidazol reductase NimA-like FMN-containing flavoprotein (pyridoxamine 5'-phosphate oxidase superfamily)
MVAMELDRNGFEVLGRDECFALLRSVALGRIGLSMSALPVVLPVNFALDGDRLLVRTAAGSKLDAALTGAVVAFEADHVEPATGEAWSVLVRGSSAVVSDPHEIAALGGLDLDTWVDGQADQWVMITTDLVSGRRTSRRPRTVASASAPARSSPVSAAVH